MKQYQRLTDSNGGGDNDNNNTYRLHIDDLVHWDSAQVKNYAFCVTDKVKCGDCGELVPFEQYVACFHCCRLYCVHCVDQCEKSEFDHTCRQCDEVSKAYDCSLHFQFMYEHCRRYLKMSDSEKKQQNLSKSTPLWLPLFDRHAIHRSAAKNCIDIITDEIINHGIKKIDVMNIIKYVFKWHGFHDWFVLIHYQKIHDQLNGFLVLSNYILCLF